MHDNWRTFLLWLLRLLIRLIGWRPRDLLLHWLTLRYALLTETKPRGRYGRRKRRYRRR